MLEFRLYYDDLGRVLHYTTESLDGNYIVIDKETYLNCRHDIKVVDGKICSVYDYINITKLVPSDTGTRCAKEDVCIIVNDDKDANIWEVKTNEYRNR